MKTLITTTLLALAWGCSPSERPSADGAASGTPTLATVTAERTDLLFRYTTKDGPQTATRIDEIPPDARQAVHVVDMSRSPRERAAGRVVQIFDLRTANEDGTFPGKMVPRSELEQALAQVAVKPKQARVTMYSASWCGVCRKARTFLTKEGIAFVEKDIEKDKAAAAELAQKAKRAGVQANGVPVFDVGGRVMSGFDPESLLRAARGG